MYFIIISGLILIMLFLGYLIYKTMDKEENEPILYSKYYGVLYDRICKGEHVPCFVESREMKRIAVVKRFEYGDVFIGAEGIEYGSVRKFMLEDGRTELDIFHQMCEELNLMFVK